MKAQSPDFDFPDVACTGELRRISSAAGLRSQCRTELALLKFAGFPGRRKATSSVMRSRTVSTSPDMVAVIHVRHLQLPDLLFIALHSQTSICISSVGTV